MTLLEKILLIILIILILSIVVYFIYTLITKPNNPARHISLSCHIGCDFKYSFVDGLKLSHHASYLLIAVHLMSSYKLFNWIHLN